MFGLGVSEVLIILVAALIFIGPKKLPALAKTLGSAFREFQNATKGLTSGLSEEIHRDIQKPMKQPVDDEVELKTADEKTNSENEEESGANSIK